MPLRIPDSAPTLIIRKSAFETAGLARAEIDTSLGLTDGEFRVEGGIVAVGPVFDGEALTNLIAELERRGLTYFEDFFDLSGNWPEWLSVFAMSRVGGVDQS